MATNFTLTLDTAGPANPTASINGGAAFASSQAATVAVGTSDGSTTGYQVKIWGSVDPAADANIQATEGASSWITLATPHSITLSAGDGVKTINIKLRDDVLNESVSASDTITLDTTAPIPNITVAPDRTRVSKISTRDTSTFQWASDAPFEEYKVKVVSAAGDPHTAGTTIPTTAGSTNMAGAAGGYPASTNITSSIKGADLETASAGDGEKVIKVFVREESGNWSV